MQISILFFASFKEQLETNELTYEVATNTSIEQLCIELAKRGERWNNVFSSPSLLIAVNQEMVELNYQLSEHDEVAFFPPVTGG